jgi:hypothetical protein
MHPKAGGPCQGIRNSIPHLEQLGVQNEVVCLDNPDEEYGIMDHFKIHKLGKGITSYQYHSPLFEWLRTNLHNYDRVIVHGIWQFPNYAVYRAIKELKKIKKKVPKVIIMPHGMMDPYFQKSPERKKIHNG